MLEPTSFLAEGVGFEPTLRKNRKPDFESGAFDLSATLPVKLSEVSQRLYQCFSEIVELYEDIFKNS